MDKEAKWKSVLIKKKIWKAVLALILVIRKGETGEEAVRKALDKQLREYEKGKFQHKAEGLGKIIGWLKKGEVGVNQILGEVEVEEVRTEEKRRGISGFLDRLRRR